MTGTDNHIAGLGNLIEWTNISGQNGLKGSSQMSTAPQRGMPGYEGNAILYSRSRSLVDNRGQGI